MNDPTWKTIGILGGMGPEATAELYRRIISICQRNFGAKYDSDFPPIFIYSLPLPDIVESSGDKDTIIEMLEEGINKLKSAGCDFIAVPCNTVFYFIDKLGVDIPILNIIEETLAEAKRRNFKKVGILSTVNTAKTRLYENIFDGVDVLQPSVVEQERINKIILKILTGFKELEDREYLKTVTRKLKGKGAEAVILGCTELPLLIPQRGFNIEVLDTLQILAEITVKKARGDGK